MIFHNDQIFIVGLRQKIAEKTTQMHTQQYFDIVLNSFLLYLGFKHCLVCSVFSFPCMGLKLISASKMFNIVYAHVCYILGAVAVDYSSFIYCKVQQNRYKSR
ncbi:hypothetical protein NIES3974_09890 [Calothrix sp. NIES-3974]|nr:hypothetical protein NIES3974_09890 [Calothrix sp. NIES-3974]